MKLWMFVRLQIWREKRRWEGISRSGIVNVAMHSEVKFVFLHSKTASVWFYSRSFFTDVIIEIIVCQPQVDKKTVKFIFFKQTDAVVQCVESERNLKLIQHNHDWTARLMSLMSSYWMKIIS